MDEGLEKIYQKLCEVDAKIHRLELKADKLERLVRPVVDKVLGD